MSNDGLYANSYVETSETDMLSLDVDRRAAESDPERADWQSLARRYEAQGRPAMAAKCRGRQDHYARQQ